MEIGFGQCFICGKNKAVIKLGCVHEVCTHCFSHRYALMITELYKTICSGSRNYDGATAFLGCCMLCPNTHCINIKDLKYLIMNNPDVNQEFQLIITQLIKAPYFKGIATWFYFCKLCNRIECNTCQEYHCRSCGNCALCGISHIGYQCSAIQYVSMEPARQAIEEVKREPIRKEPSIKHALSENKSILEVLTQVIGRTIQGNPYEINEFAVCVDLEMEGKYNSNKSLLNVNFEEKLIPTDGFVDSFHADCVSFKKSINARAFEIFQVVLPISNVVTPENWKEEVDKVILPSKDFILKKYTVLINLPYL